MSDEKSVEIGTVNRAFSEDLIEAGMTISANQLKAHITANNLTVVEDIRTVSSGPTVDFLTGQKYWNVGAYARVLSYE